MDPHTRHVQLIHHGRDRHGAVYNKLLRFNSRVHADLHSQSIRDIITLLDSISRVDAASITTEELCDAYMTMGHATLMKVAENVHAWTMDRLPGDVRLAVHGLQDCMTHQRTDFGSDPDVISGEPYVGTGYP